MIEFKCSCGVELRVPDNFAGKTVTCNNCKRPNIQLPRAGQRLDLSETVSSSAEETIMAEPPARGSGRKRELRGRSARKGASSKSEEEAPRRSNRRAQRNAPEEIEEDLEEEYVEEEKPVRSSRGSRKSSRDERPASRASKKREVAPEPEEPEEDIEVEIEEEEVVEETVAEDSGRSRSRGSGTKRSRSRVSEDESADAEPAPSGRRGRKGQQEDQAARPRGRSLLNTSSGSRSSKRGSSKGREKPESSGNDKKKLIIIIAAVVVALGGGGLFYFMNQKSVPLPASAATTNNTELIKDEPTDIVEKKPEGPASIDLNNFDYEGIVIEGKKLVDLFGLEESVSAKLLAALEARKSSCFEKKASTEEYNAILNNIIKTKLFFLLCVNDMNAKLDLSDTILGKEVLCGLVKMACAGEVPIDKLKKDFPKVEIDKLPTWDKEEVKTYIETMKTYLSNDQGERLEIQEIDWDLVVNLVQLGNPMAE